ncbi:MAG: PilZ domain-containing protein [Bacteriovoracia bacterium]
MTKKKSGKKDYSGSERRRFERRPVLDTFSLFVVVPKKGIHRLPIHDLSEVGIGFDFDMEGEGMDGSAIESGETLDIQVYLNQSLYIPLPVKVARLVEKNSVRRVGAEFHDPKDPGCQALLSFLKTLDVINDVAVRVEF